MSDQPEKPLSFAMTSALQAVARLKGDSILAWPAFQAEREHDNRLAPAAEPDPRQRSKPTGR